MLTQHYLSFLVSFWRILDGQWSNWCHLPSDFSSNFQSSLTIFCHKLLTREGRVLANGWTHSSSMTIFVHLFIRSVTQKVTIVNIEYHITRNIVSSAVDSPWLLHIVSVSAPSKRTPTNSFKTTIIYHYIIQIQIVFCLTYNILPNIPTLSMNGGIFHIILLISQHIVMDLNNVVYKVVPSILHWMNSRSTCKGRSKWDPKLQVPLMLASPNMEAKFQLLSLKKSFKYGQYSI